MNEISIISVKELQFLNNKNEYIFIHFGYTSTTKIDVLYNKIKKKERSYLINLFSELTGIDIRVEDILGRLHIVLLKTLVDGTMNNIVISNIAFLPSSFAFLMDNLKKIFDNLRNLDNKKVIIVDCDLNDPESVRYLDEYFKE